MKTILITIADGEVSKNILRTAIFPLLKARARIVLLVHPRNIEQYKKLVGDEAVVEAMPSPPSYRLDELFGDLFLYSVHTESILVKIEHSYASGGSWIGRGIKRLMWFLGGFRWYRLLWRAVYRQIPDASLDSLFERYKPSLALAANLTSSEDARFLKAAKRFKVPTVGLPKGWDNLTLKTFLPVFPDLLLLQTPLIQQDALALDYPAAKIRVVGFPKFDVYADHTNLLSREMFMQRLGLDPSKKLILYAGAGDQLAPHDEEILASFLSAVEDGSIIGSPQVLVRPHPKYRYRSDILPPRDFWKLDVPGKQLADSAGFYFDSEDVKHLMNSLYHCDLLVHTVSTLGIEAAVFDKPSVSIAYDAESVLPQALSTARYYRYVHLRRVFATGGAKVAHSFEELVRYTNDYLAHPEHDKLERARIATDNAGVIDGRAGERAAEAILELLG